MPTTAENEARLRKALADARMSVRDFDAILAAVRELMAQAWDEGAEERAGRDKIEKSLGRRDLDCGCCSAVDDVGLNDLIAEVLSRRDTHPTPRAALGDACRSLCGWRAVHTGRHEKACLELRRIYGVPDA